MIALSSYWITFTLSNTDVNSDSVSVDAIDFVGEYAYVVVQGDYPYFIAVLDVSDPASPELVQRYVPESEHNPWNVVIQGQYAYLNGLLQYIDIVDVSDPLAPYLVSTINAPGHPRKYGVDGDYLYVDGGIEISIIDVANPARPKIVGSYDINTNNIAKVGDYLYTVGQTLENGEAQPPKLHIFQFVP